RRLLGPYSYRHCKMVLSEFNRTIWNQPQLVDHVLSDTSRRNAVIVDLAEAHGMQTILQPLLQGLAVSSPRRQLLALLGAARLERRHQERLQNRCVDQVGKIPENLVLDRVLRVLGG